MTSNNQLQREYAKFLKDTALDVSFEDWAVSDAHTGKITRTGKHCPDCGQTLTYYTDDEGILYNLGDLVGRCDNPDCVSEGSTWRIKRSGRK
jgi:hypothetical protein